MAVASVIVFPGSNCDRDLQVALGNFGFDVKMVWHKDTELPKSDLVGIPGGFSYGDYLRSGAMSASAPIMKAVKDFAEKGGLVLGICNGFQVLTEAGILPGILTRNLHGLFICRPAQIVAVNTNTPFTLLYGTEPIEIPIAHHDGNYYADDDTIKLLEDQDRIAFRYVENINGSINNIAGILNEQGNVLGMMPHPERAVDPIHTSLDGVPMFESLISTLV